MFGDYNWTLLDDSRDTTELLDIDKDKITNLNVITEKMIKRRKNLFLFLI